MIISTDNPLSTGVMSSWGKQQKSIVTPYVCKALCDFVAEKENLDREQFSNLWEDLARRTFYRGSEL